eukprot:TRINITY_DN5871_c0_g1_i2.p2 TRINITY_DN5871_c0_g1~~TRINITY_DN5871_c0_g1_i2.p2  ORF type:complete len:117 (+),score=1.50 TRINITY_DN5871_c0_g1_i2:306-656(+)
MVLHQLDFVRNPITIIKQLKHIVRSNIPSQVKNYILMIKCNNNNPISPSLYRSSRVRQHTPITLQLKPAPRTNIPIVPAFSDEYSSPPSVPQTHKQPFVSNCINQKIGKHMQRIDP